MLKKILQALLGCLLVAAVFGGFYWLLNKERLQQEYVAYKKISAPVLMYHGIGWEQGQDWPASLVINPPLFEEQLQYLTNAGYHIVSVEQLAERFVKGETVDKYIALSFDDGYKNNYTEALPLLEKYRAKASFFVVNRDIGSPIHMNEEEIRGLIRAGMELGSHTMNHTPLTTIEDKYLAWELSSSRYFLKKQFDRYIVRTIAYPNGCYNQHIIDEAMKYGFYRGLTGKIGVNTAQTYHDAPMAMYRVNISDDGDGIIGFQKRLERAYLVGFLQSKGLDVNIIRDFLV